MRWCILLLLLPLISGCDPYYVYGPGAYPPPVYPSAYQPPYYGSAPPAYAAPGSYDTANCGTPDQPKPCYR
jgi:hypothetical protein